MDARNRSRVGAFILSFPLLWFLLTIQYCTATDTLTQSQQISVGQTLISSGQIFELGFFTPSNSSEQYIGIWYKKISVRRVLWVANRESPLAATDSASSLIIDSDGNLKLLNGMKNTVWSANVSVQSNSTIAMLSDKGNFVLQDNISGMSLWESFNYPCDTFLPGMMVGMNIKTGVKRFLSSWLKENDPSPGKFTSGITLDTPPQGLVWNGSEPYWRAGPWNGLGFVGVQETTDGYGDVFRLLADNLVGFEYITFNTYNTSFIAIMVITSAGSWEIIKWNEETNTWDVIWSKPDPCDTYGFCGPFGFCNKIDSQTCECLKGFVPKSSEDWSKGTWSGGCVRKTELFCEKNTSRSTSGKAGNDGFWKMSRMKLPDHFEFLYNEDSSSCQQWCLGNCSCVAYSYVSGIGCMVWGGGLLDMEQFSSAGEDLFLRLAHSELVDDKKKEKLIISFTTSSGVFLLGAIVYGLHRWRLNQRGKKAVLDVLCIDYIQKDPTQHHPNRLRNHGKQNMSLGFADAVNTSRDTQHNQVNQQDTLELPMFDFNQIVAATNNFCPSNKLGQGGFGPVIKGKLQDGQEIAVKRLSRFSGQGIEEFKNEIILISKLQHRNLVRLLGCCIEGEEMLIVYEYMANKSLDTFLFDPDKKGQLDWAKRFNIIQGIARGLLYLHRDSCLKIIHRDLKTSNVLLDKDMNPKISDFGLARTFLRSQELANTRRVVGTYGYMSPEYALGGIFSEKSDVFSFGVLLLEIICSRKNTSFNYRDQYTSLLGYAWELWNEGRALDFVDEALVDSCTLSEVMRCIHIGLLCVQDHAPDRPTMSTIILMLTSEIDGPQPKKPTFTFQSLLITDHQPQNNIHCTNDVTISIIEGR